MSKSVISDKKICVVCGAVSNLHRHHIFYGTANRRLSERHGCWCYLCGKHHNLSDAGVHFNKVLDDELKMLCQRRLEAQGWTREKFMSVFGRNYL